MKTTTCLAALFASWAFVPQLAHADANATKKVTGTIEKALVVLKDPALQGKKNRAERHKKLRAISDETIDWKAMSQRSLGVHWRKLDEAQRERFSNTFSDLLAAHYMKSIDNFTGKEKLNYIKTEKQADNSVVKMQLVTRSREKVPLDFFVNKAGSVFDVSIEGVSIANHFRGSFDRQLVNGDFETLMKKLERKVAAKKRRLNKK